MPLNIRNEEVDRLAVRLAARKGLNKTDAVKLALENELRRLEEAVPLKDRLRPIQDQVQKRPLTGPIHSPRLSNKMPAGSRRQSPYSRRLLRFATSVTSQSKRLPLTYTNS